MGGLRDGRWSLVKHFKASTYKKKKKKVADFISIAKAIKIFILKITVQWDPSVTLNTSQRHWSTFVNQRKNDLRFIFPVLVQYWLKVTMVSCRYSLIGRSEPVSVGLNLCRTVSKQSVQEEIGMVPQSGAQREGQNVPYIGSFPSCAYITRGLGPRAHPLMDDQEERTPFNMGKIKKWKCKAGRGGAGRWGAGGWKQALCLYFSLISKYPA